MENRYQHKILTIPNLLSLFRLALIPVFVWLYVGREQNLGTAGILLLSGLTDVVDGWIARTFHMVSDFGKVIDPVADKLTQIAMLFCLVTRFPHMRYLLVLLFLKEMLNSMMGLMAIRRTGYVLSSAWHGKVTTVLLYTTIVAHLIWFHLPASVSDGLLVACAGMILLSAVLYFVRNGKMILCSHSGHKRTEQLQSQAIEMDTWK